MLRKRCIFCFVIMVCLYLVNNHFKYSIQNPYVACFMQCYFNDFIGTIALLCYFNILFTLPGIKYTYTFWQVEFLMLLCGVFWEFVTPLFRPSTTTDFLDMLAYLLGGCIFWMIVGRTYNRNMREKYLCRNFIRGPRRRV